MPPNLMSDKARMQCQIEPRVQPVDVLGAQVRQHTLDFSAPFKNAALLRFQLCQLLLQRHSGVQAGRPLLLKAQLPAEGDDLFAPHGRIDQHDGHSLLLFLRLQGHDLIDRRV